MASEGLVGSRIRERRQVVGLRQADLARQVAISASYLNLIEHNRRRIGGKLLVQIAEVLGVETALLSEGAEAALVAALRDAEASAALHNVELDRIEEFAGRFPGWARLVAATHERAQKLEQTVEGLSDRIAHDPALAASVHEVLSTAASIRATASILAETDALEPEWLDRFHANINEDSARLADSSRTLVGYLEQDQPGGATTQLPTEEVDSFLAANNYVFEPLEDGSGHIDAILKTADISDQARAVLRIILLAYCADADRLPLQTLRQALADTEGHDPMQISRITRLPVALVMRRMASLPEIETGYVLCDRSGSLLLRKALPGFALPRFGASCPLWPLFQALSQPGTVVHTEVQQLGQRDAKFDCYATTETQDVPTYNAPPLLRSGMLILPSKKPGDAIHKVGASCRICPRTQCPGRREPSVLTEDR